MRLFRVLVLLLVSALVSNAARAQELGQPGPSYVGAGSFPSGDKPQSKLSAGDQLTRDAFR